MIVTLPPKEVVLEVEDAKIVMRSFSPADLIEVRTGTRSEQMAYILSKVISIDGVTLEDGTPVTVDQIGLIPDLGVAVFAGYLDQMNKYFEAAGAKKKNPQPLDSSDPI